MSEDRRAGIQVLLDEFSLWVDPTRGFNWTDEEKNVLRLVVKRITVELENTPLRGGLCERCDQPVVELKFQHQPNAYWKHLLGKETPCPRACPKP